MAELLFQCGLHTVFAWRIRIVLVAMLIVATMATMAKQMHGDHSAGE